MRVLVQTGLRTAHSAASPTIAALRRPSRGVPPGLNDALVQYRAERERVISSYRDPGREPSRQREARLRAAGRAVRDTAWDDYMGDLRAALSAPSGTHRPPADAPSYIKALLRAPRTRVRAPGEEEAAQKTASEVQRRIAARRLGALAALRESLDAEPPITFETLGAAVARAIDSPVSYSRSPEEMVAARRQFRERLWSHTRRIHDQLSGECGADSETADECTTTSLE